MATKSSFSARAELPGTHPLSAYLLQLIAVKQSNLCVSADVYSTSALLRLAEEVGDYICVLKTHADIVDDFGERTIKGLREISRRKKFLIFEDRKLGDIGSTVQNQYTRGPLAIVTWAHLVNAHIFPGPAIIPALAAAAANALKSLSNSVSTEIYVGTPNMSADESGDEEPGNNSSTQPERKGSIVTATTISQTIESSRRQPAVLLKSSLFLEGEEEEDPDMTERLEALGDPPHARGLLLLAEMSSEGSLLTGEYTLRCVEAAQKNRDFVLGFVSQRTLNGMADNFLSLTPGVKLPPEGEVNGQTHEGDRLGQQYRTPEKVIYGDGCDIIIVGRGILGAKNRAIEAERYRAAAWKAYESRIR